MMSKNLLLLRLAAAVLLLLLAGCPNPSDTVPKAGSLTITVANNINAKTLLPPLSMDAASYLIMGTGPGGATFSRSTDGVSVTIDSLAFGAWSVTVDALNADRTVIGHGEGSAAVHTGETTALAIAVTPLPGNGALSLGVSWIASQVEVPSMQASLISWGGSATSLDFTIAAGQASCSSAAVAAGYYTLTFQLLDNRIPVMGAVEVVRIVSGQTTSGTYAFANVNQPGGTLVVNITPDLANPIPVSIAGVSTTLVRGRGMTATASVSDGTSVVYVWYLNGASRATGSSWALPNDLPLGYYRLDVTAFSVDGKRAGSATASFQVVPLSEDFETYAVGAYPSAGGWYELWSGAGPAAVVSGTAFSGNQSLRMEGFTSWVHADGITLPLDSLNSLTYRAAVMVPSGSATGASLGFFVRLSGNESRDFNSVYVIPGSEILAVGATTRGTGIICQPDTWYDIIVQIDYGALLMNMWVNGREVVWNLPAREKAASNTFYIGTTWSGSVSGTTRAFFDHLSFY